MTQTCQDLMELLPDLLVAADSITITTHLNPDGDGYCAALALQRIIAKLGKPSTIWMDNDSLERFDFLFDPAISLSESRAVVRTFSSEVPDQELSSDLLFILDCNSFNRVGARRALVDKAKRTVLLDHHILENHPIQADYSIIDPTYVSVGAIIFELFKELVSSLADPDRIFICNCLYSTILNDTNNYANANTNAAVFRFASELSELGIRANVLHKEFFLNHSAEEMRYVGQTLATIQLHLSRRILTMYSTIEMSRVNNIDPESVMNITRWVQGVSGTDAIIYFREEAESCYKLSLRSVHLDVNTIAVKYGGGGHRQASGCTMEGSLNDVMATILADFRIAILEYDQNR